MNLATLGASVVSRRTELGFNTRQEFAEATGLSYRILGDIERGSRHVSAGTWAVVEQWLHWAPGSASTGQGRPILEPPPRSAAMIRGLSEAYAVAAELVDCGDDELGPRLLKALAAIGERISHTGAAPH